MSSKVQVMNQSAMYAALDLYDQIEEAIRRLKLKSVGQLFRAAADKYLSHLDLTTRMQKVSQALRWFQMGSSKWRAFGDLVSRFIAYTKGELDKVPVHRKKHLRRRAAGWKACRNR